MINIETSFITQYLLYGVQKEPKKPQKTDLYPQTRNKPIDNWLQISLSERVLFTHVSTPQATHPNPLWSQHDGF